MQALTAWQCLYCSNVCDDDQEDSIKCFACKKWAHQKCSGLKDQLFEAFCDPEQPNLEWICNHCVDAKNELQASQDPRIDKLLDLIPLVATLSNRLENIEKNLLGENLEEKIEEVVDRKLAEAMNEQREVERRKKNLIIVNLKESSKTDIKERIQEDLSAAKKLLGKLVYLEDDDITDPIRLGKEGGNKPRLMRVTIKTEKKKQEIHKKAPELNREVRDKDKRVFVNPDYTKKERETHKMLRDEMKKRIENGEQNLAIRQGKIVTLRPRISDKPNAGKAGGDTKE